MLAASGVRNAQYLGKVENEMFLCTRKPESGSYK